MKITASLTFPKEPHLLTLLRSERFEHPRATYTVEEEGGITIRITAEDATALKTAVNSVCRVATVYEKAR